MDERAFIAHLEAAEPDEFAELIAYPTADEERVLRLYFGDERFQRLHGMAVRQRTRSRAEKAGHVVVIPGIMGSELTAIDRRGNQDRIWLTIARIAFGRVARLRLSDDGLSEWNASHDIRPTGVLKRYYGDVLLALNENWDVRAFWFDWRKDLSLSAAELHSKISNWFGDKTPVHIVAHSMGGLVARTYIAQAREHWERSGGRLVMLGTPNHGSFAIPQVFTGADGTIRKLALADLRHDLDDLLAILNSFVGTYQMLPSPLVDGFAHVEGLYRPETWGRWKLSERHLRTAQRHHEALRQVVDTQRMTYIAGFGEPTLSNVTDFTRLDQPLAYDKTFAGDGRVPHVLGRLHDRQGNAVSMYFVAESHGSLPNNRQVQRALDDLLATGATQTLPQTFALQRGPEDVEAAYAAQLAQEELELDRLRVDVDRLRSRGLSLGRRAAARSAVRANGRPGNGAIEPDDVEADAPPPAMISARERDIEDSIVAGVLVSRRRDAAAAARELPRVPIEIGLVCTGIDMIGTAAYLDDSVDAIAVGHYVGTRPAAAELAIDVEISTALAGAGHASGMPARQDDLLLTQFSDRGVLRGELGQPFFMADPRVIVSGIGHPGRVLAIAGMGYPGRFGVPELTVLVRELCWSLGRMGKQHLATVLIGSGNGNLTLKQAVSGWLRGIEAALGNMVDGSEPRLRRMTIAHHRLATAKEIRGYIEDELRQAGNRSRLDVQFVPASDDDMAGSSAYVDQARLERQQRTQQFMSSDVPATRITATFDGGVYRIGAITDTASVPERAFPLDPALVDQANRELAGESDPQRQFERGLFLQQLMVPSDLRSHLEGSAPVVMMLDTSTAALHWEMLAQPDPLRQFDGPIEDLSDLLSAPANGAPQRNTFLGTERGFTRQLRSTLAPPPEPPPPPRRVLRVLVVADPAEDAPLPGADREGVEVADLFESFNDVWDSEGGERVEVMRLIGPREATRTNVLRAIMLRRVDVLHFAGHCYFNKEMPSASGWIFSNGETLTAHELNRIDRVPRFVFSNACESGVLPDRPERRTVELAPSFAQVFFERGVANFVCTAWPVDDAAARHFALMLYSELLALEIQRIDLEAGTGRSSRARIERLVPKPAAEPQPMYLAMQRARQAIAETNGGARTWGAYQHYGNPNMRFFDPRSLKPRSPVSTPAGASVQPAAPARRPRKQQDALTAPQREHDAAVASGTPENGAGADPGNGV
jgi:pimeloyl-ACP methyl ester carboxylesterase